MLDSIFRLLDEMDSFKKVILFLLTGLTALSIWLGYRLIDNYSIYQSWQSVPHTIDTVLPCSLVQIRSNHYLISISFPVPKAQTNADKFTSSFWVSSQPDRATFDSLCRGLVKAINSNEAESVLAPYNRETEND